MGRQLLLLNFCSFCSSSAKFKKMKWILARQFLNVCFHMWYVMKVSTLLFLAGFSDLQTFQESLPKSFLLFFSICKCIPSKRSVFTHSTLMQRSWFQYLPEDLPETYGYQIIQVVKITTSALVHLLCLLPVIQSSLSPTTSLTLAQLRVFNCWYLMDSGMCRCAETCCKTWASDTRKRNISSLFFIF